MAGAEKTTANRRDVAISWFAIVAFAAMMAALNDLCFRYFHADLTSLGLRRLGGKPDLLMAVDMAALAAADTAAFFVVAPFVRTHFFISRSRRSSLLWLCLVAIVTSGLIGIFVLQSFANSGDEYAYQFQAWTFGSGHLWNKPPPLGQAMASSYTWVLPGKWAGNYSPGWPLMMVPVTLLGLPGWLINLLLMPAVVVMAYDMVARRAGATAGRAAALLLTLSLFTIFNAASFFPHFFSLTLILLACWAVDHISAEASFGWALLIGGALGMAGITRMIDVIIVIGPIVMAVVRRDPRWVRSLIGIGMGGAPFLAGLLWYQWMITGHPLEPTYYVGGRTVDHLYFDGASIRKGLQLTILRLGELSIWTSPPLILFWVIALWLKFRNRSLEFFDAILPLAMMVMIFYPFAGGNRYGPRYYFDFWFSIPLTFATAWPLLPDRLRRIARGLAPLTIVYGAVLCFFIAQDIRTVIAERREIFDRAAMLPGRDGIVCIRSTSGEHAPLDIRDLPRNGIHADGPMLYVLCRPGIPAAAHAVYPNRRLWYYDRKPEDALGTFTPEDPS